MLTNIRIGSIDALLLLRSIVVPPMTTTTTTTIDYESAQQPISSPRGHDDDIVFDAMLREYLLHCYDVDGHTMHGEKVSEHA